jgi:hypothetical protein
MDTKLTGNYWAISLSATKYKIVFRTLIQQTKLPENINVYHQCTFLRGQVFYISQILEKK